MCEPTSIMLAISVASAAASAAAQADASRKQSHFNAQQTANALQTRAQNANQIGLERLQATDAAGQKINENNQAQRQAQATTIAQAGPAGLSVDSLLSDMGRKGATYNESVNANLDRTNMALDNQLQNVNNQAASTINQERTPATPDYLGAALKIGGAYYGANSSSGSAVDFGTVNTNGGR